LGDRGDEEKVFEEITNLTLLSPYLIHHPYPLFPYKFPGIGDVGIIEIWGWGIVLLLVLKN